ncbi:DUF6843 domain-containing protein [Paenibacillus ehimensis]|uniref:DUF6843 domain-containing protein n=1 Tax=Paenibacillus ehimensis TaxID=79264 RepID=A0ABT8V9X8_9BACL|nr:hypothetical protein [Paenibacillus ehimensis]MDO3677786.1 hypothetical protein [Paenibacillus ehimensis]
MLKKLYVLYLVVFLGISIAAFVIGNYGIHDQKSHIYLLPDGYTGWVEIRYEQEGSPPLIREGKKYVHLIPRTGVLNTSDSPTSGGMEFYYLDEQGKRNKIGLEMIRTQAMKTKDVLTSKGIQEQVSVNVFFVGTGQQWNDAKSRN